MTENDAAKISVVIPVAPHALAFYTAPVSYQVFARKYRPNTFDDVLGQDHVVKTLRNAIAQERLAHAYLFVGPRGTGKTSTARILAKALNCPGGPKIDFDPEDPICVEIAEGRSIDVLEIDGASNNGVEQVRELRETVKYAPAHGKFKIYYIDEVHMLSNAAFNALLKTLEEPPPHVKFIFATTEPNKILPTIISRCQRFDLRPIPPEIIAKHLLFIAKEEKVELDEAAAWAIAKGADGGMRDAQSMLDQLVAFCGEHISEANVLDVFGFTSRETIASLLTGILQKKANPALALIHEQSEKGKELSQLLAELVTAIRALVVAKLDQEASREGFSDQLWAELSAAAEKIPADRLLNLIDIFAEADSRMKWASNKRLHFEIATLKAIQTLDEIRLSDVIKALGNRGENPDGTRGGTGAERRSPEANVQPPSQAQGNISVPPVSPSPSQPPEKPAAIEKTPETAVEPPAAPVTAKPDKKNDDDDSHPFSAGIFENAPEASEAPPEPEKPITPEKIPELVAEEPKKETEPEKDPLIAEALAIFKGKLIN